MTSVKRELNGNWLCLNYIYLIEADRIMLNGTNGIYQQTRTTWLWDLAFWTGEDPSSSYSPEEPHGRETSLAGSSLRGMTPRASWDTLPAAAPCLIPLYRDISLWQLQGSTFRYGFTIRLFGQCNLNTSEPLTEIWIAIEHSNVLNLLPVVAIRFFLHGMVGLFVF